jgi:competence protein ComEC
MPRPLALALPVIGLALVLAISLIFLLAQALSVPDGKLHVYFFDVGQGDSILIVTPQGRQILVDGGPQAASATRALPGPLSPWDRSLDLVALSHLDADHSRGLVEVLRRYRVGAVLEGVSDPTAALYPEWQAALERHGVQNIQVYSGHRILVDEDVVVEVLHPPPPGVSPRWNRNNDSLVLRLVYGEVSFLLTGDIEDPAERLLSRTRADLGSLVMQVAHHGSRTSTTAGFLELVSPQAAVISAGAGNRYGHPHPEVVERLEQSPGAHRVYRTADHGNIQFISDGRAVWVKTQR